MSASYGGSERTDRDIPVTIAMTIPIRCSISGGSGKRWTPGSTESIQDLWPVSGRLKIFFEFLDTFRRKKTFLLVDPVMGDNGKVYTMFTEKLCSSAMKELVFQADVVTPNLTELCLLTDTDFRMIRELTDEKHLLVVVEQMAANLMKRGPKNVVVTGIHFRDATDGVAKMGNLAVSGGKKSFSAFPYIGGSYSGTGDLFASVVAAGMARGDEISASIELAGAFIERAITDSVREGIPRNDGVDYEQYLGMLLPVQCS